MVAPMATAHITALSSQTSLIDGSAMLTTHCGLINDGNNSYARICGDRAQHAERVEAIMLQPAFEGEFNDAALRSK